MAQILLTDAYGYLLINFNNMNQLLNSIRLHEHVHILTCLLKDLLPVGVCETQ